MSFSITFLSSRKLSSNEKRRRVLPHTLAPCWNACIVKPDSGLVKGENTQKTIRALTLPRRNDKMASDEAKALSVRFTPCLSLFTENKTGGYNHGHGHRLSGIYPD
jgi:hypothetical protein